MKDDRTWRWRFLGFRSVAEGRPVQAWFNSLPEEPDRYEITDLLDALQKVNDRPWAKEVFDPLEGAGGISEIKIPNIRCERDGKFKCITYRIYGFFGPKAYERSYTFLHGTEKEVKNDAIGKQIAKGRLDELLGGFADVHKFEFQEEPNSETAEGTPRPN
jgi:hypothetical protein